MLEAYLFREQKENMKGIGKVGVYNVHINSKNRNKCVVQTLHHKCLDLQSDLFNYQYKPLLEVKHSNLAKYLGFVKTDSISGIVSEMIYGVTLRDDIDENVKAKVYLAESIVLNRLYQLLQAVDVLSRAGVYHQGLTPCSVMLCRDDEVKVCNYGVERGTVRSRRRQRLRRRLLQAPGSESRRPVHRAVRRVVSGSDHAGDVLSTETRLYWLL